MGKQLDRDVLIDHLRRMMEARQIDRLPRSGYAKAIQDIDGCPTVDEPTRYQIKTTISNVDIPAGVTEEQYYAVMGNIYDALARLYGEVDDDAGLGEGN